MKPEMVEIVEHYAPSAEEREDYLLYLAQIALEDGWTPTAEERQAILEHYNAPLWTRVVGYDYK